MSFDHVLSTLLFAGERLSTALLDQIQQAGIPAIELFCARQHLDYRNRSQITELGRWLRDSKLKVHSLHLPIHNDDVGGISGPQSNLTLTEPAKAKRIAITDELKRALEISEIIPFEFAIQHLGVTNEEFDERKVDSAFTGLEELRIFAKARGVEILLENTPNELATGARLMEFVRITHLDFGFCFDTGHANLHEGIAPEFEIMKDRIRSTHLHNNDGQVDSHLFPFAEGGTIDWSRTMQLFRTRPRQFPLVLELHEVPELEDPLSAVRQVFDRLESIE